jgi:AraC-like DNA-binding protein
MKHSIGTKDSIVKDKIRLMKVITLPLCVLALLGGMSAFLDKAQDMSVEELLTNLKTEQFSGRPIDISLENVGITTIFSHLEKFSGISFEFSPNIPMQSLADKAYSFKQVPWDRVLSLILRELSLEAIPMDGGVYLQPKKDTMLGIIREDQVQTHGPSRIPPLLYFLAAIALIGGITGFLFYRKRQKAGTTGSGGFVIEPERADEIAKRVTYLFDVEKIFRKEDVSVQSVSEKLSIPSYQLSWVINKKMNATFSGLVNSYRIEEVKKKLVSSQDRDKTILEIAYDAGFNTKTSFNRVFKKLTKMTPSQYRGQLQQKKPSDL